MKEVFKYKNETYHFANQTLDYRFKSELFLDGLYGFINADAKNERVAFINSKPLYNHRIADELVKEIMELVEENDFLGADLKVTALRELLVMNNLHGKESIEFFDSFFTLQEKVSRLISIYFNNPDHIKKFLTLCINEADRIDFDLKTDAEVMEFDKFFDQVRMFFFLKLNGIGKKFRK